MEAALRKGMEEAAIGRLDMAGSAIGDFDHLGWILEYEDGR
jgi:hypothetical protein